MVNLFKELRCHVARSTNRSSSDSHDESSGNLTDPVVRELQPHVASMTNSINIRISGRWEIPNEHVGRFHVEVDNLVSVEEF